MLKNHKDKTGDCLHLQYNKWRWKQVFDVITQTFPVNIEHGPHDPVFFIPAESSRSTGGALVCIPPKCGSSSLKTWLFQINPSIAHSSTGRARRWTSDMELSSNSHSIALTRPYLERFLSAYYDKAVCGRRLDPIVQRWIRDAFGQPCFRDVSNFALRLSLMHYKDVDQHFRPQAVLCGEGTIAHYDMRLPFQQFVAHMRTYFDRSYLTYKRPSSKPALSSMSQRALTRFYAPDIAFVGSHTAR